MKKLLAWVVLEAFLGILIVGCSDDDGLDKVGQACDEAADCYPGVDQEELSGEVVCLDQVDKGYCTHHCETDEDCCAVPGECNHEADLDVICSPFEATAERFCFISCEEVAEGDSDDYCKTFAHPDFLCRSTGGGAANRRVCVPEG